MEKAIGDLPLLDEVLRATDEETYDKTANTVVTKLGQLNPQDLGSKEVLDVSCAFFQPVAILTGLRIFLPLLIPLPTCLPSVPQSTMFPPLAKLLLDSWQLLSCLRAIYGHT